MVKICPVSTKQINENLSRLNALMTVLFTIGYFTSSSIFFLIIIAADFGLRNIYEGKFNPVIRMNKFIANKISLRVHLINAGPKIFAARVGLFLSLTSLTMAMFSFTLASAIPAVILGFFAFLEGAVGFCVACKLYPYLRALSL